MQILKEHGHVTEVPNTVIEGKRIKSAWQLVVAGEA